MEEIIPFSPATLQKHIWMASFLKKEIKSKKPVSEQAK